MGLCGRLIPGEFQLEVIDVTENPESIQSEQLLALPMLVRLNPLPVRRVVGDLSDAKATAVALNLATREN
jgi:circadian clock protein KaiB